MSANDVFKAIVDKLHVVPDEAALAALFTDMDATARVRPVRIAFVNAHAVNLCCRDPAFLQSLLACDYVFRDGSGMGLLYKFLKRDAGLNLNGTDLIPRIVVRYKGQNAALFGTNEPWLGNAASKIAELGATPSILRDGFQNDDTYAAALKGDQVQIIILAMGMPKQERVAARLAELNQPGLILCGGAILDFLGGKVTRAPALWRRLGIEWVYRLLIEPKRLFKRYLVGNFTFTARAFLFSRSQA